MTTVAASTGSATAIPIQSALLTAGHLNALSRDEQVALLIEVFARTRKSPHTQIAYRRDLGEWTRWCSDVHLDPLGDDVVGSHIEAWITSQREDTPPPAESTIARRLSSVSSWYRWLVRDRRVPRNPAEGVDRPEVDQDESTTLGLSRDQAAAILEATGADTDGRANIALNAAIIAVMLTTAVRGGELIALDFASLGSARGHRTVRIVGKRGKVRTRALPPIAGAALDGWLAVRGEAPGPLFQTRTGRRLTHNALFRIVKRMTRLGHNIRPELGMDLVAAKISPHGLRHTAITGVLDAGASLRDAQDFAGHADPRTTRRYDRARGALDRDPTYLLSQHYAAGQQHHEE
jgi:integrase/recombinase XerD